MQGQELGTEGIPAAIPPPTLGASFHHATTQQQVPSSAPRLEGVLDTRPQPSQSAGQRERWVLLKIQRVDIDWVGEVK